MLDFEGLAAALMSEHFERKVLVIGMRTMPVNHCAENIQTATETIVNKYDFNKSKLKAISCDEGSAYVRLFKQILSSEIANNIQSNSPTTRSNNDDSSINNQMEDSNSAIVNGPSFNDANDNEIESETLMRSEEQGNK